MKKYIYNFNEHKNNDRIWVHIITWDNKEYDILVSQDEIDKYDKLGYVTRTNDNIIIDFR